MQISDRNVDTRGRVSTLRIDNRVVEVRKEKGRRLRLEGMVEEAKHGGSQRFAATGVLDEELSCPLGAGVSVLRENGAALADDDGAVKVDGGYPVHLSGACDQEPGLWSDRSQGF